MSIKILPLSLCCLAISLHPLAAVAQESLPTPETLRIQRLIQTDFEKNRAAIQAEARLLSLDIREQIYADRQKQIWVPMLVNGLVTLGIGSLLQGDMEGFLWAMGTELVGVVILSSTVVSSFQAGGSLGPTALLGAGLFTGGWIYSLIRPVYFSDGYNTRLYDALLLNEPRPVSLEPLPNNLGFQLSWAF